MIRNLVKNGALLKGRSSVLPFLKIVGCVLSL